MPELQELMHRAAQQPTRPPNVDAMWRRGRQLRRRRRTIGTAVVSACLLAFAGTLALLTDSNDPQTLDVTAPSESASTAPSTTSTSAPTGPTKGPVVDGEGGRIDWDRSPDFIVAVGNDGEPVGYIRKSDLNPGPPGTLPPGVQPSSAPLEVYDETLTKLVGHHVPGVGFVPLGQEPPPRRDTCGYLGADGVFHEDVCSR